MEMQSVASQSLQSIMSLLSDSKDALEGLNYQVIERIGTGRFGDVYKCRKRLTGELVAVKVITILDSEKRNGVPYLIIREASVLKELDHVNIVRLMDVLNHEDDVFLVFEYLDLDLHKFITSPEIPKDPLLIKNLLHQILSGVAYCHSHKILHRDLKPQNILVDLTNYIVKLADFGVARAFEVPLSLYSNKVGSPWYRAPELLFGSTKYSTPIDIWSVGCIFAEMVIGRPLITGEHEWKILKEIFSLLGTPTEETWPGLSSVCNFMEALGAPMKPKDLALVFPDLEPTGVDLLSKMLCQCPNHRISAEDALKHPYFEGL